MDPGQFNASQHLIRSHAGLGCDGSHTRALLHPGHSSSAARFSLVACSSAAPWRLNTAALVKAPVPMVDQPAAGPVDQELDAPVSPIRRRSPPHAPLMKGISSDDDNGQIRRRKEHARSLSPTRGRPKIGRRPWPRSRGAVAQAAPPEVSGLVDALEESPLRPAAHALAPPHPGPQLPLFCSRPSPKVPSEAV